MYIAAFIIFIIIMSAVLILEHSDGEEEYIAVKRGKNEWKVIELPNHAQSVDMLEEVNRRTFVYIDYVEEKYGGTDLNPDEQLIKTYMDALLDNYNPEEIYETDPRDSEYTSYTVDKGRRMHLCLRSKNAPYDHIDVNTMMFVKLHEMAHVANYDGIQHTERFWVLFRRMLEDAADAGVYRPHNYDWYPVDYCGMIINYQPMYDPARDVKLGGTDNIVDEIADGD